MQLPDIATAAAALLLVIAGILVVTWLLRRYMAGDAKSGTAPLRRRDRRLGVVEAAQIGNRHRLLLVRRDDREHLILIGGATELVIESGIERSMAAAAQRAGEPRLAAERDDAYRSPEDRATDPDYERAVSRGSGSPFNSLTRGASPRIGTDLGRAERTDYERPGPDLSFARRAGLDRESVGPSEPRLGRSDPTYDDPDDRADYDRGSALRRRDPTLPHDDERRARRGPDDPPDDPPDQSHSRILSRFLKGGS